MALRCLPIHCAKDLLDFLQCERFSGNAIPDLACGTFPVTLFIDDLVPDIAKRLVSLVERAGGWGIPLCRAENPLCRGEAVLLRGTPQEILQQLRNVGGVEGDGAWDRAVGELVRTVLRLDQDTPEAIRFRGKVLEFSEGPMLMAVLNVTPDSFSDGGRYLQEDKAVERALQMIEEGASILDIGGASSRPGSDLVPEEVQMDRVLPVIRGIRRKWNGWMSVDTVSSGVARAAMDAGADMINDISAGRIDPEIRKVAADFGAPAILMHMKGTPADMQLGPVYDSLFTEIIVYFEECIRAWENAGVQRENILVDPGIGFGKTLEHNLHILRNLEELRVLGRPVVLGTSRKSFIDAVLGRKVEERLPGTLATLAVGAMKRAHVFRVHDVSQAGDCLKMVHAIERA